MTTSSNSSPKNDPWQQLRHCCAPELFCVPKTWSDPFRPPRGEIPHGLKATIIYVQNNLIGKPWCNTLALLSLVMAAQNMHPRTILGRLSTLHSGFERLFAVLELHALTDWNVDTHLALYLTGQLVEADTQTQRAGFWRHYRAGSQRMKSWLKSLPTEQQAIYTPFILPHPADVPELTRLSEVTRLETEQQERRKADTDALMPFYADLRTHGHLRYNLVLRLWKAYQQAIKRVEAGQAELPLTFALTEGGYGQIGQGPPMRLIFKLWDR